MRINLSKTVPADMSDPPWSRGVKNFEFNSATMLLTVAVGVMHTTSLAVTRSAGCLFKCEEDDPYFKGNLEAIAEAIEKDQKRQARIKLLEAELKALREQE